MGFGLGVKKLNSENEEKSPKTKISKKKLLLLLSFLLSYCYYSNMVEIIRVFLYGKVPYGMFL